MKGRKIQSRRAASRDFRRNNGTKPINLSAPKRGGYRM